MKTLISSEYGLTISCHLTSLRQWLSEKNTDYNKFQYATQYSTYTRQNTLFFIILELKPMYTLVSVVHVCTCITVTLKGKLSQTRLAHSVEPLATNLKVVGSSQTVDKKYSFCIFLHLAGRLSQYK